MRVCVPHESKGERLRFYGVRETLTDAIACKGSGRSLRPTLNRDVPALARSYGLIRLA